MITWRNTAIALALLCGWMQWRACTRFVPPPPVAEPKCEPAARADTSIVEAPPPRDPQTADGARPALAIERNAVDGGLDAYGFHVPGWAVSLAPQQGEDLLAYRDRIVPLAQAAIAPQRARVARSRDNVKQVLGLDTHQLAELDGAASDTATAIEDRVLNAALSGDFDPSRFKPMTAVAAAGDVLALIEKGNARFLASLSEDQKAKLAQHPFDFIDYLVFSTRWEDLLGVPK